MTHDMGQGTPQALGQDRRCQTLEAAQNTAEEPPRRAYCGDTARKEDREKNNTSVRTRQILYKK